MQSFSEWKNSHDRLFCHDKLLNGLGEDTLRLIYETDQVAHINILWTLDKVRNNNYLDVFKQVCRYMRGRHDLTYAEKHLYDDAKNGILTICSDIIREYCLG